MDVEKIIEQLKKDPKKLAKVLETAKDGGIEKALKEHGIDVEPEKVAELGKKLLENGGDLLDGLKNSDAVKSILKEGGDMLKGDGAKELLDKGGDLLKGLLGGKK